MLSLPMHHLANLTDRWSIRERASAMDRDDGPTAMAHEQGLVQFDPAARDAQARPELDEQASADRVEHQRRAPASQPALGLRPTSDDGVPRRSKAARSGSRRRTVCRRRTQDRYSLRRLRPASVIARRAGFSVTRRTAPSLTSALSASVRAR